MEQEKTLLTIVTSNVKKYNKLKGKNTSAEVIKKLDAIVKSILDAAVVRAIEDGRKTVMDRDIEAL